ncbi:TPA: ABC transporter permease [bacterium]|nr:ABC transporter permease [bacterium]
MSRYVLKRLILMVITFSILIFLIFFFIRLMPDFYVTGLNEDPAIRAAWIKREGIDKPIFEQFIIWVTNIFKDGNFGYSFVRKRDVIDVLAQRLPETIKINFIPFLISIPLGIALGIIAALKKNKLTDHIISVAVMILISIPSFVVAVVLQYLFVYKWNLLPSIYVLPKDEAALDPMGDILSRVLPTVVLASGMIASWTRLLRAELSETLTSEFMLLARAKGLTKPQATLRHALRNAFVPFSPALIGGLISLLSGSLIIEKTFRIAGVGGLYLAAIGGAGGLPDYPMVMIISSFYLSIGLLSGIVSDLSYGFIDPRIKMGAGKQ